MEFTYPSGVLFDCNKCGLCCGDTPKKTRRILLLESEAKEISVKFGLPIECFAKFLSDCDPYYFEMNKGNDGRCFFLDKNKCNIYEMRPLICRFYPFELKFDPDKGMHTFNFTYECPTMGKGRIMSKADFEELFRLAKQKLL